MLDAIIPDQLSDLYEVLMTEDTRGSRKYVDFMASVYQEQSYKLIECSQITPEERIAIFKLAAKVNRMYFKQKQLLVSIVNYCLIECNVTQFQFYFFFLFLGGGVLFY